MLIYINNYVWQRNYGLLTSNINNFAAIISYIWAPYLHEEEEGLINSIRTIYTVYNHN